MRKSNVLAVLVSAAMVSACSGGPAQPKLTQMNESDGARAVITYNGNKMLTLQYFDKDGSLGGQGTFVYDGDRISTITATGSSGSAAVYNYAYVDGRLTTVTMTASNSSYTLSVTYSGSHIAQVVSTSTSSAFTSTTSVTYTYAGDRVTQLVAVSSYSVGGLSYTSTSTTTYIYDSDQRLSTVTTVTGDNTSVLLNTYDEDGRLAKVVSGNTTYTLEYLDGKVSRINYQNGNDASWTTYTYDSGDVLGFVGTPSVTYGQLFDLAGKMLPQDQVYVTLSTLNM